MGWVVTTWRVEEELRAAERETRRLGRIAARERADAAAHLDALAVFGEETLRFVRQRRAAIRPAEPFAPAPPPVPAAVVVPEPLTIRARRGTGRASMRDSPLADLFRAVPAR